MTAEKALVLLLGRLEFEEAVKTRIFHIIKNGVDWYDFLNHCVRANMVCLVYQNMLRLGIEKMMPATVKNNMRYHYEQNAVRNQYLLKVLGTITQGLAKKGIVVVPTKGVKFLGTIYSHNPGVRLLNDIDILAVRTDKSAIHDYMKRSNFCSYLINNEDAFCAESEDENCHFYISFTDIGLHDDVRVDFDYTYPADFLDKIREGNYLYEFCYLCRSYYSTMAKKYLPAAIDQFDYIKLVDIHEYCKRYLNHMSTQELLCAAEKAGFADEAKYTLACAARLELQLFQKYHLQEGRKNEK